MPARGTIGIILDSIMVQRFSPGLVPHLSSRRKVWFMDLYRPVDELLKAVKANHTDAIITRWVCDITDRIAALGLPVVAYSYYGDEPNVTCVDTDNAAIGALAARHFMDRGLRSFAFIGLDFP